MYTIYNNWKEVGKANNEIDAWRMAEREFDGIDTESDDATFIVIYDEKRDESVVTLIVKHF